MRLSTSAVTSAGLPQRQRPGAGRLAVCGLLTAVGVLVAAGAAFNLWVNSVSFGGRDEGSVSAAEVTAHLLVAAAALAVPPVAARVLLGRVPTWLTVAVAGVAVLIGAAVLGVSV